LYEAEQESKSPLIRCKISWYEGRAASTNNSLDDLEMKTIKL